jgi:hypothetical protein
MSKRKSILGMYALAMGALAFDPLTNKSYREHVEPKETEEERKKRLAKAEIERYKAQGLTEFFYGENSLWALNQKSADKKARKRHWL